MNSWLRFGSGVYLINPENDSPGVLTIGKILLATRFMTDDKTAYVRLDRQAAKNVWKVSIL